MAGTADRVEVYGRPKKPFVQRIVLMAGFRG